MLTLYFSPGASSMAPHIALHEIGVPFEARPLSFSKREQRNPAYLALNPEGKVPTLLIDGRPLTEVAGVLYYLAKTYPQAGLFPADGTEQEAQAISWMSFIASTIHPSRRAGPDAWRAAFDLAEKKLAGDWTVERYSIADIHLFRLYWRFARSRGAASGACPRLDALYDRMMARPAVQKTLEIEGAIGYELPQ
jgi:glutathione S-transferase